MKKKLLVLFTAGTLFLGGQQATAQTISVDWTDHGTYFVGLMGTVNMWVYDRIMFRDHPAFDGHGYMKFDVDNDLAGFSGTDVTSATLSFSTMHVNENLPLGFWRSPYEGTNVNIEISAYDSAVDMTAQAQPGVVTGSAVNLNHTVAGLAHTDPATVSNGTYIETINIDVTGIVRGWADGDYANNGFKLDLLGASPGEKFYMWTFIREEVIDMVDDPQHWVGYEDFPDPSGAAWGAPRATLEVNVVPVPAAVWLLASGLVGLIGLSRRKK